MRIYVLISIILSISHVILLALFISWILSTPLPLQTLQEQDTSLLSDNTLHSGFQPRVNQSLIVFFFITGGHVISLPQAHAVISASHHHPDWTILVFKRPWMKAHRDWSLPNLVVQNLNETEILFGTPLWNWFIQDWSHSQLYEYHLGDALRLAFLSKYGGVYLDTDVLILRSLNSLPWNCLGYEDDDEAIIDGAVMKFQAGHPVLELAMRKFVHEFRDTWAYQGPALMTRVAKEYQKVHHGKKEPLVLLPYFYFYPLSWKNLQIKMFYKKKDATKVEKLMEKSYAVHLWNKATRRFQIEKGSFLQKILDNL